MTHDKAPTEYLPIGYVIVCKNNEPHDERERESDAEQRARELDSTHAPCGPHYVDTVFSFEDVLAATGGPLS